MGGDHGHGHHGLPKIPDYRIYKVEDVPELMQVRRILAAQGLKDPWARNEVWRYSVKEFGTKRQRLMNGLFRGFKWGLGAAIITTFITKALEDSHDEHGHH